MNLLLDGDSLERCPNCFHTISMDGLNDPDCECYCHKMRNELQEWLLMVEERRG